MKNKFTFLSCLKVGFIGLFLFCNLALQAQIITTIAGNGIGSYSGDSGLATVAEIFNPLSVAVDRSGNFYIADYGNHKIRKVNSSGIITTIAGNGTAGYSGDGGAATIAELYFPTGVAVDSSGNVYIADNSNQRIRKVNTLGIITTIAGNGTFGFIGDGGAATSAELYNPQGVAVDNSGNIYIADMGNRRIRKVNTLGIISTIAGNGTEGYGGDGGAATSAELYPPQGIAIDGARNIYIADFNLVRKVDSSGIITTVAGNGTGGYGGDGGVATVAELNYASGVNVDSAGNIYIADQLNSRIRIVNSSGIINTIAGSAYTGFFGDGGPATAAQMNRPTCISLDGSGNIYIADQENNRIRKVGCGNIVSLITGSSSVCEGSLVTLSDSTSGGTWGSTNGHASVTGGIVSGVTAGIDTIEYVVSNACGTATSTVIFIITINPLPDAGTVTGDSSVCVGASITLSDYGSSGTWSGSDTNAIVASGIVTGAVAGMDSILYSVTNSCGTAVTAHLVTVNPLPDAGIITGSSSSFCAGVSATLSDSLLAGTWSATNTNASIDSTGVVTGATAGTDSILYTVSNSCGISTATLAVTINPLPYAGSIAGPFSVCSGATITLSDTTSGGSWSAVAGYANVDSMGIVTGVSEGIDTIKYSFTNYCGTSTAHRLVTVNPLPSAGTITGASSECVSATILLTASATGGAWSALNGNVTVDSLGHIIGIMAGTDTIGYTVTTVCGSAAIMRPITVNPLPVAGMIMGEGSMCNLGIHFFTNSITGGIWTISNPFIAAIGIYNDSTGILVPSHAGIDSIYYSVSNICGTATVTKVITVLPLPDAGTITTIDSFAVCQGSTITLTDTVAGGTWSEQNGNTSIAGSGVVTGNIAGTDIIIYTFMNSCGMDTASVMVNVDPLPPVITIIGGDQLCVLPTIMPDFLIASDSGGTWMSSNILVAAVVNGTTGGTGIASGTFTTGTATISYTITNGCGSYTATLPVTVNAAPTVGSITGPTLVCIGSTISLTDGTTGGTWSELNGNTHVAGNLVTGVAAGTDSILYTNTSAHCGSAIARVLVTVDSLPVPFITRFGDTLATSATFAAYKWMKSGSTTVLGTNATYITTDTGSYMVEVSNADSCTGTSAVYIYLGDGVADIRAKAGSIKIYPNPTRSLLYIQSPGKVNARLTTIDGREILDIKDAKQMDMSILSNGVYFITVFDGNTGLELINEKIIRYGN